MKNIILTAVLLVSGVIFGQDIKPKFEIIDNMVKATYYHDNGNVKEEGFYLDGKLHGKWSSYNQQGEKLAIGEYANGAKTGKWFFWAQNSLSEVDYNNSKLTGVKKWSKDALAEN
jgi:antitoxin component YwqK of YwqJK toxin-antitoxin module